ncbi:SMP-30/gluconolactonase/LRE family protein [Oryzicola mucosus]|uniref:SMP-30/gluconolactonase/LRE family protein n=1 Tax=Oryzicola mucosus TaxID=2767425 RepID=A0A8J6U491_9HYPH|nr:SMP-30/gluconolactonase/LRE family protein [Oryzicola mucosus]MBD0413860.1 SMP-30/gluconolactonase/LRE family protein [Oryzicola mucosus]
MVLSATRISKTSDMLGESPVWDADSQKLFWVDSFQKLIRSYEPSTGAFRDLPMPSMVGSVGLATGGKLVAGLADGIYLVDIESGAVEPIFKLDPPDPRVRFNDGKVDRQGRFVCGTMGVHAEALGELYRINSRGDAQLLANGIRIANSLCFSPGGDTMYFADSLDRRVRAYHYSEGDDPLDDPRIHVDTKPFDSGPDGATIDSEGFIWVALVQVGKIARFDHDGLIERTIEAPTDMPSCVAFGGPDMSTLFVTTIKDSGSGRAISRHPAGGHLFAIEGLGVKGIPEPRFSYQPGN